MKKGILITFEGIEGSGKTIQANLLKNYLVEEGYKVILVREPGGTKIGERIRKILLSPRNKILSFQAELFLYLAARAQLVAEKIKPALLEKQIVICDRFTEATLAYQGYGRGIPRRLIRSLNQYALQKIKPDLTFLLDISPTCGLKRTLKKQKGKLDRVEQEGLKFLTRVREGYLQIAGQEKPRIKIISPASITQMHRQIKKLTNQLLSSL